MIRFFEIEPNISPIQLKMSHAVPIGLILNELITNSIKYSFNDNNGTIWVNFKHCLNSDCYHLQVIDDGIGLPDSFSIQDSTSFGLNLVKGLAEQLGGHLTFVSDVRARFDIYIPTQQADNTVREKVEEVMA